MPLINEFQKSSDFGTLKNDSQGNYLQINVNAGTLFNPTNPILASVTVPAGKINGGLRARGASSKYGIWVSALTIYSDVVVSIPSMPGTTFVQALYCTIDRINPTTVRLTVGTDGVSGSPPTFRIDDSQTIAFQFSTFLSPFD